MHFKTFCHDDWYSTLQAHRKPQQGQKNILAGPPKHVHGPPLGRIEFLEFIFPKWCILVYFHARKQLLLSARLSHRNSVCPSVCPFVHHTGSLSINLKGITANEGAK